MLRAIALGLVVFELALGLAHTGVRLARAPSALRRGWPAASELEEYLWLEPYARGRSEIGFLPAAGDPSPGSALAQMRFRVQHAIAPARLVMEPRSVSVAMLDESADAEHALAARGFACVRRHPRLPLAIVSESPLEPARGPPPLPPRAPPWRLAAVALAGLLALACAWRRGGPATAACFLTLAPGVLALCCAASDASGVPETLRTPLLASTAWAALVALAFGLPALEPPGARGARLGASWSAAHAAQALAGAAALTLALGGMPDGGWDAQAMYAMRARTIVVAPEFLAPFADFPGARELHPDYPPLVPFALAGAWRLAGGASPCLEVAVQLSFALGFAILCARWALSRGGPTLAVLALSLTALAPFWHDRIAARECDAPLGAACGVAVLVLLWRHGARTPRQDVRHALVCGAALALAACTKNEGRVYALAFGAVMACAALGRGRAGRGELAALGATFVPAGIVLLLLGLVTPPNDLVEAFDPSRASWTRAGDVALAFARQALRPLELRLLPPLLLPFAVPLAVHGVAALRARRRDDITVELALLAMLATTTAAFFGVYLTTPADLDWHLATSLWRLASQLWPGLVVLAVALVARGLDRERTVVLVPALRGTAAGHQVERPAREALPERMDRSKAP